METQAIYEAGEAVERIITDDEIGQFAKELPREGVWWRGVHIDMSKLLVELLERAQKAEAELRRCYKDIEQLTAERNDLKAMLADAGIRNAVLEKRIDRLLDVIHDDCECESFEVCSNHVSGADCATGYDCKKCWRAWLEQEVRP